MKNYLFASLLLLASCGTKTETATETTPTADAAPAAPVAMEDLDLTSAGAPLLLKVPVGTKATKSEMGDVDVKGPGFALKVNANPGSKESGLALFDALKAMAKALHSKEMVNEPMAYRYAAPDAPNEQEFSVFVANPDNKNYYYVSSQLPENMNNPFTTAQYDVMYTSAHEAKMK